jgi:hypothetical protein
MMTETYIEQIYFNHHCQARSVRTGQGQAISQTLAALALPRPRPMILVSGSGRATDAVLAVRGGHVSDDPRIAAISHQGSIYAHDLCADPAALREAVRQILAAYSPPAHT